MLYHNSIEFAHQLDSEDKLSSFRERFYIPEANGQPSIYLCGNSLGLQPKSVRKYIETELLDWQKLGVEGHFHGKNPWYSYHKMFLEPEAKLVGALPHEIAVMNVLTVNLHLMMVSFYRPEGRRIKILMEAGAFPSDQYAMQSQVRFHGYNPDECIIELNPRQGEYTLRTEDIIAAIETHSDTLALVMMGGVNYYTGQAYEMEKITIAAHQVGAYAGFDLAHAAGNLVLRLHDWGVDFAVWCTYKYLNSGPGGVSGVFIHERWADQPDLPRFAGWWGYDEKTRFQMKKAFVPSYGASGWQLSNAPVLTMAVHKAALDIFEEAGMERLHEKSKKLTGFLEYLILENNKNESNFSIITPSDPKHRGAQLSILTDNNGKLLFNKLLAQGVIADWREPNVIRVAPVPLYNTFEDVYRFVELLRD